MTAGDPQLTAVVSNLQRPEEGELGPVIDSFLYRWFTGAFRRMRISSADLSTKTREA